MFADESTEDLSFLKFLHDRYITFIYLFRNVGNNILRDHYRIRYVDALNETVIKQKTHPITTAIISESSIAGFEKTLDNFRNSTWWNHEAYIIVVNKQFTNSCYMAQEFLYVAWTYKILSTLYLCRHYDNRLLIYTYNPYSYLAPKFWNAPW